MRRPRAGAPSLRTALVLCAAALACQDVPGLGELEVVEVVSGNAQFGQVGTQLPAPLVVRVRDANQRVVFGATIVFQVTSGGGLVSPETTTVGDDGVARARWTLGTTAADSQRARADVLDPVSGDVAGGVIFRATPRAGPATTIVVLQGDGQTGDIGAPLPQLLQIRVEDGYGNPQSGPVTWRVADSTAGSVEPQASPTPGVYSARWTLGASMTDTTVLAIVPPLPAVTFTAFPRLPSGTIATVLGDSQVALPGTVLSAPVGVWVTAPTQAYGLVPVRGVPVSWAVTAGGGAVGQAQQRTNVYGAAETPWTLGAAAGVNSVTATAAGADLAISALAYDPADLIVESVADSQPGLAGLRLAERVGVRLGVVWGGTRYLRGASVAFAVTAGGGGLSSIPQETDSAGYALADWILGALPGLNTLTVTHAGRADSLAAMGFDLAGASLEALNDLQTTVAGAELAQPVGVGVTVTWGSRTAPVPDLPAAFSVTTGGGSIASLANRTDAAGRVYARWILGAAGSNGAQASFVGRSVTFTATGLQAASVVALTAGGGHSCAVTTSGTTWCWGLNDRGQLGDGSATNRGTPVAVAGGVGFTVVAAGAAHTCALDAGGLAYCWGDNTNGQLGDGTLVSRPVPTAVGGPAFAKLAPGTRHTCGLTAAGTAYCWGDNAYGQLGESTTTARLVPTLVAGGRVFTDIIAGASHTCGLSQGAAWCWGSNFLSQIGAPTTAVCVVGVQSIPCSPSPLQVGGATFTALASGYDHTCGLVNPGSVWCWGDVYGSPTQITDGAVVLGRMTPGAPGYGPACALTVQGVAICWVALDYYYYYYYRYFYVYTLASPVAFASVVGGAGHGCGVAAGGQANVWCWGDNTSGQLGDGTTTFRDDPRPVLLVEPQP